jgi:heme exporter protein A
VDLRLSEGERVAVVGPNGAGKSTLVRILATLLRPDGGTLSVAGAPCPERARAARRAIGFLGHDPLVYPDLSARENLELYAALHGVRRPGRRIEDLLDRVGLLARSLDPVRVYSRGMAQRLGIARLLLHRPRLLLLDEPYGGLDAAGARILDEELADMSGRALLIVTHELGRARSLADRVLVMRAGRVRAEARTA